MSILKKNHTLTQSKTKYLVGIFALCFGFLFTSYAYSEPKADKPAHHAKHFERIAKKLKLDEGQKEALMPLLKKHHEERKAALEPLRKQHDAELAKILSAEQIEQLQAMKSSRKGKFKKKMSDKKHLSK